MSVFAPFCETFVIQYVVLNTVCYFENIFLPLAYFLIINVINGVNMGRHGGRLVSTAKSQISSFKIKYEVGLVNRLGKNIRGKKNYVFLFASRWRPLPLKISLDISSGLYYQSFRPCLQSLMSFVHV